MTSNVTVPAHFDYSAIEDKDVRGKLINIEGRIKKRFAGMMQSVVEVGEDLAAAQAVLAKNKNGTFIKWSESTFGFSKATTYRYVNVFNRFGAYRSNLEQYDDCALYALADPETPKPAVTEAEKLASKGNRITHSVAKDIIAKHKPPSTNGKSHGKVDPPPVVEPPKDEYKPKHSDSVKDDTEKCPNCGCNWWRPVQGGGHDCDQCCHPLGESVGESGEDAEPEVIGDLEQAELSKPVEGALKKARSALGILVRYCDDMKLTARAKPHLEGLAKLIGK